MLQLHQRTQHSTAQHTEHSPPIKPVIMSVMIMVSVWLHIYNKQKAKYKKKKKSKQRNRLFHGLLFFALSLSLLFIILLLFLVQQRQRDDVMMPGWNNRNNASFLLAFAFSSFLVGGCV